MTIELKTAEQLSEVIVKMTIGKLQLQAGIELLESENAELNKKLTLACQTRQLPHSATSEQAERAEELFGFVEAVIWKCGCNSKEAVEQADQSLPTLRALFADLSRSMREQEKRVKGMIIRNCLSLNAISKICGCCEENLREIDRQLADAGKEKSMKFTVTLTNGGGLVCADFFHIEAKTHEEAIRIAKTKFIDHGGHDEDMVAIADLEPLLPQERTEGE